MNTKYLALLLFCWVVPALTVEWNVDIQADNRVTFVSKAETFIKTFTFEGVTNKIDGYLFWEDDSLFEGNEFYFEVDLNSFDTGIKKRNQDMREMVLETEKWPTASMKGRIVSFSKLDTSVVAYRVETRGTLSVHGEEKPVVIPASIVVADSQTLQVAAEFDLLLTDYGMKIPSILVAKVADRIHLIVRFTLKKVQ